MPSLEAQCAATVPIITSIVLDDNIWKMFGYRKRPRRRKIYEWLIRKDKLERDVVLMRELFAAPFARIFCWSLDKKQFRQRVEFISRLMHYCIDGCNQPIWPYLNFLTRNDAIVFLTCACDAYKGFHASNPVVVFSERCIANLNQQFPALWALGAARLFGPEGIMYISKAMDDAGVAKNQTHDLEPSPLDIRIAIGKLFESG